MALTTSFNSYSPTMALFIAHWTKIDGKRSSPLVLKDGEEVADMSDMRAAILTAISAGNTGKQMVRNVSLDRKDERAALRIRMGQFMRARNYYLAGKNYANKVMALPSVTTDNAKYLEVADTMIYAWEKANDDNVVPGGLTLDDNYTLDDFRADCQLLKGQPINSATAVLTASNILDNRNDLLQPARALMRTYGNAIRTLYKPESDEVKTLPKLWEQEEDDPDAPKLKLDYKPGNSGAHLSWKRIVDPKITQILVNIAPGERYLSKNVRRLAELAPDAISYDLPEGTIAPGSNNGLKIVAVDEGGHEFESNTVRIKRGL